MTRLGTNTAPRGCLSYGRAFSYALLLHLAVIVLPLSITILLSRHGESASAIEARLVETAQTRNADRRERSVVQPPAGYQAAVVQRIDRAWRGDRAGIAKNLSCVVHLGVKRDGTVVNVRVARSSGSLTFDASVVRAVWATSPLLPPPDAQLSDGLYEFDLLFDPGR